MKRFYSPTLMTCFKSGLMLALVAAIPSIIFLYASSILATGIAAIAATISFYNSKLMQAGFQAMMIRFSSFSTLSETLILLAALILHVILFVLITNQLLILESGFDAARVLVATTLLAFLPFTAFALSLLARNR
ncbi:hypothetical protein [Kordiimonas pumila]|uniref:Uncharacterized protein n=1 Tax=Kordiimonas pumila TaxID=2161677 RepID=A0ABV7D5K5_9PROT|nr:hypothetical protein [Kordiimonas pumila]